MKIEQLLKEPNQDLALNKAIAAVLLLKTEIEYFISRVEGKHPDGPIRSKRTYSRYKDALQKVDEL